MFTLGSKTKDDRPIRLVKGKNIGPKEFTLGFKSKLHSKLCIIALMTTKVHVTLGSFVVSTWMHDTINLL